MSGGAAAGFVPLMAAARGAAWPLRTRPVLLAASQLDRMMRSLNRNVGIRLIVIFYFVALHLLLWAPWVPWAHEKRLL
jgi:hypothetical protein